MSEEAEQASGSGGWRYAGLWLSLVLGMALGLVLSGREELVFNVYSPVLLTLGGLSLLGLSSLSLWGLPLVVPLGCIGHAYLAGGERWWRLLPSGVLLMALLTIFALPLFSVQLPLIQESSMFQQSPQPSESELAAVATASVEAWKVCARAAGLVVALLSFQVVTVCGADRTWRGAKGYWQRLRSYSQRMRKASAEQETEAVASGNSTSSRGSQTWFS